MSHANQLPLLRVVEDKRVVKRVTAITAQHDGQFLLRYLTSLCILLRTFRLLFLDPETAEACTSVHSWRSYGSYTEACSSLGLSSLSDGREQLTKHFFDQLKRPDSCLAHLMPLRRDISLTSYLRNVLLYELPKARTARYAKSFVSYCVTHFT